jgi:hypothetical protein
MATATVISLKGASARTYEFEVYPWGTAFNPVGAVYAVLQSRTDGLIYIGQTGDLSERFDNHHQAACFTQYGKTHIGVHVESSEQRRRVIESDLIGNYRTSCNEQ